MDYLMKKHKKKNSEKTIGISSKVNKCKKLVDDEEGREKGTYISEDNVHHARKKMAEVPDC